MNLKRNTLNKGDMTMKCSKCGNEAIGMTIVAVENFHAVPIIYEFRCKRHIKDVRIERIYWTDVGYCDEKELKKLVIR